MSRDDQSRAVTASAGSQSRPGWFRAAHDWVVAHDDSWIFVVLYIGLAVVLSIWISLFWLVLVVGVHFVFEIVRQHYLRPGPGGVIARVFWELKLDIGLVLFALALSLYMEITMGLLGLNLLARSGTAARAGLVGGSRFAGWLRVLQSGGSISGLQRIIRGVLLSLDDAAQVVRAVAMRRRQAPQDEMEPQTVPEKPEPAAAIPTHNGWNGRWGWSDYAAVTLTVICTGLIAAAPLLTHHTIETAFLTLASELQPFATDS